MSGFTLTVGITTRNRPDALGRCLRSLASLAHLDPEVIVYDDGSSPSAAANLDARDLPMRVRIIRDESAPGYIVGRNRIVREAQGFAVLLLDDDASILDAGAIDAALAILGSDPEVGAMAFAQADGKGAPWPENMQPGRGSQPCYVPAFIGFAHLVRKDVFLALGGYRERFVFYGEEKDFCLRLIESGLQTVYLPDARVAHEPDPAGRDRRRYLRYVSRNDCLHALYNEPLSRVLWLVPARGFLFFRMRSAWGVRDPWGWLWIAREVIMNLPSVVQERRPVSAQTIRLWGCLRAGNQLYPRSQASAPRALARASSIP
jgi:GT2 family glycosyltransferase